MNLKQSIQKEKCWNNFVVNKDEKYIGLVNTSVTIMYVGALRINQNRKKNKITERKTSLY